MNIRCKSPEKGQSLVEFIIMVPLFFIVLSGVNLYLNQEIKSLTEDSTYDSLLISDSNFDDNERKIANWNGSRMSVQNYNSSILDNSLNSSKYYKDNINVTNDVFNDKKNISGKESDCVKNPFYKLNSSQSGEFRFSSCADASGFEKAKFSYQDMFEDFKTINKKQNGKSIYYPESHFAWEKRSSLASNAVKYFITLDNSFQSQYASLLIPDEAQFNANCLMNPKTPNCSIPSLLDLWNQAALTSAFVQVGGCNVEMIAKCGGPEDLPCLAAAAEQTAMAFLGNKAPLCSIINNGTQAIYEGVLDLAEGYSLTTSASETKQRSEIFL